MNRQSRPELTNFWLKAVEFFLFEIYFLQLLYSEHGESQIPTDIVRNFFDKVKHIDITSNAFTTFDCLVDFLNLKEIILDNNFLSDKTLFPTKRFMSVELLSLNNNKVLIYLNISSQKVLITRCGPSTNKKPHGNTTTESILEFSIFTDKHLKLHCGFYFSFNI